jgi:hypothetical protein
MFPLTLTAEHHPVAARKGCADVAGQGHRYGGGQGGGALCERTEQAAAAASGHGPQV